MKRFSFGLILSLLTVAVFSQDRWEAAIEAVYSNQATEAEILGGLAGARQELVARPWSQDRELLLARIGLFEAKLYLQRGRSDRAEALLVTAEQQALAVQQPETAFGLQVLAEVRVQFFPIRGVPYIIGNAGAVEELAKRALVLDPQNPVAGLIFAYGKINAPAWFGGDLNLAQQLLSSLVNRPELARPQRFTAWLGLAEVWRKQGDQSRRQAALDQARRLYPQNWDLQKATAN